MDIKVDSNSVVVFDLDDTLYNELDYLRSAYSEIAQKLLPDNWKDLFSRMFSLYRCKENVFRVLAEDHDITIDGLLLMYRNHNPRIKPFEGVIELMAEIKKNEGKIAIVTDGRTSTQNKKIDALGIRKFIDEIVISEEIGTEKPSAQNFLAIEKAFSGCSYVYIADNRKKDFITPNTLGWNSICLIDNGKNIHQENYLHTSAEQSPKKYIFSIQDLKVV